MTMTDTMNASDKTNTAVHSGPNPQTPSSKNVMSLSVNNAGMEWSNNNDDDKNNTMMATPQMYPSQWHPQQMHDPYSFFPYPTNMPPSSPMDPSPSPTMGSKASLNAFARPYMPSPMTVTSSPMTTPNAHIMTMLPPPMQGFVPPPMAGQMSVSPNLAVENGFFPQPITGTSASSPPHGVAVGQGVVHMTLDDLTKLLDDTKQKAKEEFKKEIEEEASASLKQSDETNSLLEQLLKVVQDIQCKQKAHREFTETSLEELRDTVKNIQGKLVSFHEADTANYRQGLKMLETTISAVDEIGTQQAKDAAALEKITKWMEDTKIRPNTNRYPKKFKKSRGLGNAKDKENRPSATN